MKGVLYLIPNTLGNPNTAITIPPVVTQIIKQIDVFIVEDLRNARRYLKNLVRELDLDRPTFFELNEHTPDMEVPGYLTEVLKGKNAAVVSEAGLPGIADPGAVAVRLAHQAGIRVIPLTGPSSISLSLMASGLNGQSFRFHGYLPVKRADRIRRIREIGLAALRTGETQIFIEAPYRNDALLADLLDVCDPDTLLCVAADLTLDSESVSTRSIASWRQQVPSLHKRPVVFLLGRN
jgi:16S rRNA (cytidine1402-2'-O)-methyltransferase